MLGIAETPPINFFPQMFDDRYYEVGEIFHRRCNGSSIRGMPLMDGGLVVGKCNFR